MKVAVAYIPVVHKGHQEFCQKVKPDILYVLGKSFLADFPLLERDFRALAPEEVAQACKTLGLAQEVRILEKRNLTELSRADSVVFTDDAVLRDIAGSLTDILPSFERVFLRWDKMAALTNSSVSPDIAISKEEFDRQLIKKARQQANKSSDWWRQVGALIVKDGKPILEAFNQHKPTEYSPYIDGDPRANFNAGEHIAVSTALHAEAGLIAQAAGKGISLDGASLYVTTFPCPGCAVLIMQTGIRKIYYADGYSNLNAERNLRDAGIELIRVKEG